MGVKGGWGGGLRGCDGVKVTVSGNACEIQRCFEKMQMTWLGACVYDVCVWVKI